MANEARQTNGFEDAARERKVRRFTEAIDKQARMQRQNFTWAQIATFLGGLDEHTRVVFAKSIGEHQPSGKTWDAIVAVYRARAEEPQRAAVAAFDGRPMGEWSDGKAGRS